jgi:catalase
VPEEFRAGVFANASGSYKALIRFSNGQPTVNHDLIPDSRGFAVKLIGVPGKKVMPDESDAVTQDFVGANRPAFFLSTNSDYLQFFENVRRGGLDLLKWLISNFKFREMNAARKFIFTEIGDVLAVQYFSTTPYRLGSGNLAIKYSWLPVDCQTRQEKVDRLPGFSHDFLRERLAESLSQGDNCFDFLVQKQQDACEQPIEDAITEWTTSWTKLGSLVIPKQVLNQTDAGKLYCEDLSFTPWHTLAVHQPLGNINRARKVVYQAASVFRHATNKQKREEPTSW